MTRITGMRRYLIIAAICIPVLLVCTAIAVIFFWPGYLPGGMPKMPAGLKTPRVVTGRGLFLKTAYQKEPRLGLVSDIELADKDLLIAGQGGALFVGASGAPHFVPLAKCHADVVWSKLHGGVFLCRGTWSQGPVLFDRGGKTLWSYEDSDGIDDATPIDFGGGVSGVVVGMNGGGGVRLLDWDGKVVWKQSDGNVWHVEAAPRNGGSIIVHSNAGGELTVRDAKGTALARHQVPIYLSNFSLTAWIDDAQRDKLLAAENGIAYVLTSDGETVAKLPTPESNTEFPKPKGTPLSIAARRYYAVVVNHDLWSRSVLYVYRADGSIVYEEVLAQNCAAIYAPPGQSQLLLGCDGVVWQYASGTF